MADLFTPLVQAVGTGAVATIYTPAVGESVIIKCIRIVNTSGSASDVTLYHDIDGSTYNAASMIMGTFSLAGLATFTDVTAIIANSAGSIGMNAAATTTVTLYGDVVT